MEQNLVDVFFFGKKYSVPEKVAETLVPQRVEPFFVVQNKMEQKRIKK